MALSAPLLARLVAERAGAWSRRRGSQEDLASLPSHSIGVVPVVVTSVGAAGAADFTCLACPAAEAMESSFANAGVGARKRGHKTGERAAGRHRLCLCDVRLAPASVLFHSAIAIALCRWRLDPSPL